MSIGLALFLIFTTLKLLHKIDWPWWEVILPIPIEFGAYFPIFFLVLIGAVGGSHALRK